MIEAQTATVALAAEIAGQAGARPPEVNLGGGFGIPYFPGDRPLDIEAVGAALAKTSGRTAENSRGDAVSRSSWAAGSSARQAFI